MRPIPTKLRKKLVANPWYSRCCLSGWTTDSAQIEWHHNFIYAGKQVNEEWCILPLRADIHANVHNQEIRELLRWIMLSRAPEEAIQRYGLADQRNTYLKRFGRYNLWEKYWYGF